MPLAPLPYATLDALLRRELRREEHAPTAELMRALRHVRRRGRFSRREFLLMCRWKSPRARPRYERNPAAAIRRVSAAVLAARSERRRLELLRTLSGVGVPVASAILTLIDPRRYGVLDIRAWQVLFALGLVTTRPGGAGFGAGDWERYLAILRRHAAVLHVPVRTVERTLFLCHRRFQVGRVYDRAARR
ncbi:MAG: hypothetical protein A3E31_15000 [Candidatus Rokubacteria bacterium RIFCSPHIGHO2_12_FULL_73_22]|nr:MAG: hypothetical protein A3E31_15000 [Candidatus Rokubacteria bacterium RIFCSPHIGHO2_12_FULL_73_22]OGL02295.1 MAG: hypothetical protein A3D33_12220 [Candidatus Rokubacteria bacterium RIFCSPHIGHO2_02_FULL_73_26]OGL09908.1 MAG: hypothetical protein A3I14_03460 [Candidatus Rokubacteria bacterium RIFCSPLOWO2_02_FULL_73_56]OGL23752.1 MAG: hypothetical protein A3G44_10310 [Candidatus Rokubacteria bacterium RIFCSPLOWO2_12_FULL_73_47]